jgi:hypothetical protein
MWELMPSRRPPLPPDFYERAVADLEELANQIEQRPDLNHNAADRLRAIAKDIREAGRQRDKR